MGQAVYADNQSIKVVRKEIVNANNTIKNITIAANEYGVFTFMAYKNGAVILTVSIDGVNVFDDNAVENLKGSTHTYYLPPNTSVIITSNFGGGTGYIRGAVTVFSNSP